MSLLDFALKEAKKNNCKKIKTKADERKSGYLFFSNLGWKPIGKEKHEYLYEAELEKINNIEDFKTFCNINSENLNQGRLVC